jgi:hypothetical protein
MLTVLASVGEFAHRCRCLLWVDTPTPVSVMLRPKAVIVSVKKNCTKLLFSGMVCIESKIIPGGVRSFRKIAKHFLRNSKYSTSRGTVAKHLPLALMFGGSKPDCVL